MKCHGEGVEQQRRSTIPNLMNQEVGDEAAVSCKSAPLRPVPAENLACLSEICGKRSMKIVETETPPAMEIHHRRCDVTRSLGPKTYTLASKSAAAKV